MRPPRPLPPFARSDSGALISRSADIYTRGWKHLSKWRRYRAGTWITIALAGFYAYDPYDWFGFRSRRREIEEARAAAAGVPPLVEHPGRIRRYASSFKSAFESAAGFKKVSPDSLDPNALPEGATPAEVILYQQKREGRA